MTRGLGSGDNGGFTFLGVIAIVSFLVGMQNLDVNLTQDDKADLQKDLADRADALLKEIHAHLEKQDASLKEIKERLGHEQDW